SGPAQRSLTVAYATLYTGGSDGFASFTAAPIATGWSEQFPGGTLTRSEPAPFTAHVIWRFMCAGITRYEVENAKFLRERISDPLGPESCAATARDTAKRRQ